MDDNSPSVVAYRVKALEDTVKQGFDKQAEKIDGILLGFVSNNRFNEAKLAADEEHRVLQRQIDKINSNLSWVVKLVIGAVIAAVLAAAGISSSVHAHPLTPVTTIQK